jgi:isopentenyl-diphosphate delta-isomerase
MEMEIILVDENDKEIGVGEKLWVHKTGKLHRAFSIFVFDLPREKVLLQKRHKNKYHSGGLWTNTCCSHPRVGEDLESAVHRRLKEEMGFDCPLKELFSFTYKADFGKLKEYEIDHVFVGFYQGKVVPNKEEVEDWKWEKIERVLEDLKENPQKYAVWFKLSFKKVVNLIKLNFEDYQDLSKKTAIYPQKGNNFVYPLLGLAGEVGETIEIIKKILRKNQNYVGQENREKLKEEIGDILWYLSQLATELDISLEEMARKNLKKIFERHKDTVN